MAELKSTLTGSWVHAHEQDSGGAQVFVPADSPLPRSRGRSAITLDPDGRAGWDGPGPDDRRIHTDGRWTIDGNQLSMQLDGNRNLRFTVTSASNEQLVLTPLP